MLSTFSVTATSITVQWTVVNNAASYRIQWERVEDDWGEGAAGVSGTSEEFTGLASGQEYKFRVQAVPSATPNFETSDWSATHTASTNAATSLSRLPTPGNLSASNRTASTLELQWDDSDEARSFDVEYRISARGAGTWIRRSSTSNSIELTGLDAGRVYEVRVRALPVAGSTTLAPSFWSAASDFSTTVAVTKTKLAVPRNFTRASAGVDSIGLEWDAVTGAASYIVRSRERNAAQSWTQHIETTTSLLLESLKTGTEYEFQVRATAPAASTTAADSDWSGVIRISTNTATRPPAPSPRASAGDALAGNDAVIEVTWAEIARADSYFIQVRVRNAGTSWVLGSSEGLGATSTNVIVTGQGVEFEVRMLCRRDGVWSLPSNIARVTTATRATVQAPPVPGGLTLVAGDGRIDASCDVAARAELYRWQYREGNSGDWTTTTSTTPAVAITQLTNGTSHQVRVRAENDGGNSNYTASKSATPRAAVTVVRPGQVTGLSLATGAGSITASWDAISGATSYEVNYRAGTTGQWSAILSDSASQTIGGLTAGASYQVRVRATNTAGSGTWSATRTATIPVSRAAPTFADARGSAITAEVGTAITDVVVPAATGNPEPVYSVQGGLPGGLTFSTSTRTISGTPTVAGTGTITIRAQNSEGSADWSASYSFAAVVVQTAPPVPTGLLVTAQDRAFFARCNATARADEYVFEYRRGTTGAWTQVVRQVRSLTVSGLTNGSAYQVRVAARNGAGASNFSSAITVTPRGVVTRPGRPENLQFVVSPGSIRAFVDDDPNADYWTWGVTNRGTAETKRYRTEVSELIFAEGDDLYESGGYYAIGVSAWNSASAGASLGLEAQQVRAYVDAPDVAPTIPIGDFDEANLFEDLVLLASSQIGSRDQGDNQTLVPTYRLEYQVPLGRDFDLHMLLLQYRSRAFLWDLGGDLGQVLGYLRQSSVTRGTTYSRLRLEIEELL